MILFEERVAGERLNGGLLTLIGVDRNVFVLEFFHN